jgi:hypothetical protein
MIKIRYGVFETNSSSVHTLSIAQNDEIDKLKSNKLLVNKGYDHTGYLITYDEALSSLKKALNKYGDDEYREALASGDEEKIYRLMYEYDVAEPFGSYMDPEWLEPYEKEFVTDSGDRVLVFGRYGHDG